MDESIREEAERRTAAREGRSVEQAEVEAEKPKQVVEVSLLQNLHGLTSRSVLVYHLQRKSGPPVVTTPGQPTPRPETKRKRRSQSVGAKPTSKKIDKDQLFKQLVAEEKQSKVDHREDSTVPILLAPRDRVKLVRQSLKEGNTIEDAITKSRIPAPIKPKPTAQVLLQRALHWMRRSQGRRGVRSQRRFGQGGLGQGRLGRGGFGQGRRVVQSDGAEGDSSVSKQYPSSNDHEDGRSRKKFDYSRLGTQSLSGSLTDVRQHPDTRSPSQL